MNCAFDYCIYNKDSACILEEIEIDFSGVCQTAEVVSIPENKLKEYKDRRLKEIM